MLYISYNGLGEPLVHSQVLPYLGGLAAAGHRMTLLTFERTDAGAGYAAQQADAASYLDKAGIRWERLRYHRFPSLLATAYDVARGVVRACRLIRRDRIEAVHARSYVPAVIAVSICRWFGLRFLFDMRGLMADEYVDAGNWRAGGFLFRITKTAERRLLNAADEIVVLTNRVKSYLAARPDVPRDLGERITVIPCCVDDQRFSFRSARRVGLDAGAAAPRVAIYTGSVGTWYLLDEMMTFLAAGISLWPDLRIIILNQSEHDLIFAAARRAGIAREHLEVMAVPPVDVPRHLERADVGISFIKPAFSKSASSPTKVAEYLAVGLPVVVNAGVGDLDEMVRCQRVGVVVAALTPAAYIQAWRETAELLCDPDLSSRCRALVETELSVEIGIERYRELYERLAP